MHDVAMRRRLAALVIAATVALLVVSGAMLFGMGKPAQAQSNPEPPCTTDFCIDKTAAPSTVNVGDQITFTITERCPTFGTCISTIPLVDELPSGLTFVSVGYTGTIVNPATGNPDPSIKCTTSGNTVTCPGDRVTTPTSSFTATIVATTTKCGTFTNTASKQSAEAGSVTFTVVQCPPPTKEECKKGGWSDPEFAFPNQGSCVSAVNRQNRQ